MKLRNKKTGEIKNINHNKILIHFNDGETKCVKSLAELNEEWEDYEELKDFWFIDDEGDVQCGCIQFEVNLDLMKSIGNYFDTREEAEKAVEKLMAWKRLKDEGFRFCGWANDYKKKMGKILCKCNSRKATFDEAKQFYADLDLLFSGGEE